MFEFAVAVALAAAALWLLRRPAVETDAPDTELWGAFDRGEDPTNH